MENKNRKDVVVKALINNEVAVYACDITNMANEMQRIHNSYPVATTALGRLLAATTLMSSMLKNESDKITLSINGGGCTGTVMATGNAKLEIKGCIGNPQANVKPKENGDLNVGEAVGKDGFLTVIKDLGLKEPYVGKVHLATGEIAEDLTDYFLFSEQQHSIVYLNTWVETDFSVVNAGGIIVMPLPFCSEETLKFVESKVPKIANYAIYLMGKQAKEVVEDIFEGMPLKITDTLYPKYHCDCSRKRLEEVLLSLGEKEIKDMIEKDGGAQITCRFCNKKYDFSADDLTKILEEGKK